MSADVIPTFYFLNFSFNELAEIGCNWRRRRSCKHGSEPSGAITGAEFLEWA
jgi:hypothetical protein